MLQVSKVGNDVYVYQEPLEKKCRLESAPLSRLSPIKVYAIIIKEEKDKTCAKKDIMYFVCELRVIRISFLFVRNMKFLFHC